MPLLNVSAHHYTPEDFTRDTHRHLLKRRNATIVHLDHRTGGLGSNSCGPLPLQQYLVQPEPMSFAVGLRPVTDIAVFRGSSIDRLKTFAAEKDTLWVNLCQHVSTVGDARRPQFHDSRRTPGLRDPSQSASGQ